ncbi:MAG: hypothetical protein ACI8UO_006261, partial [Verrucomicrobiales bacterium]
KLMSKPLSDRLSELDRSALSAEHASIAESLVSSSEPLEKDVADFLPVELQRALELPDLRQTHRLEGPRIHSVTYVLLPGVDPATAEVALIDSEWSWWKPGKVSKWSRREDGGCSFVLSPVPMVPSKVGIELEPQVANELPVSWGEPISVVTFAARFFADFEGPGRYEVLALDGGCALRSCWDGVARCGLKKLMPLKMILKMHLDAEAGTAGFPFPKGTGFPGLVRMLSPA